MEMSDPNQSSQAVSSCLKLPQAVSSCLELPRNGCIIKNSSGVTIINGSSSKFSSVTFVNGRVKDSVIYSSDEGKLIINGYTVSNCSGKITLTSDCSGSEPKSSDPEAVRKAQERAFEKYQRRKERAVEKYERRMAWALRRAERAERRAQKAVERAEWRKARALRRVERAKRRSARALERVERERRRALERAKRGRSRAIEIVRGPRLREMEAEELSDEEEEDSTNGGDINSGSVSGQENAETS
ncbi:uncharacterized protein LOC131953432 [Physella acuta]|uniref:uncharacterized protein LOC131953432 n=1 Tax=Physella acuta TaxID=109671 RepID=UPI0027DDEEB2|nr:uncharacterized protein LOC131953432 [Physella acuta]XP_059172598.1 uncharacterized protein LOC131953432 [Physella acuta]